MKFEQIQLGEICNISSSKRIFAKEYEKKGIPFYRGKEIIEKYNGKAVSNELYISRERYEEIKERYGTPQKGDILLTSVGTLGIPWLVDEDEFYFKDGNLTWLSVKKDIESTYLYWWLISPEAKNQINAKSIGSTQKALTIDTLNKFVISLPSLEVQKKICNVLQSLQDKICVNTAINKNLSVLIQTIYQKRFTSKCQGMLSDICMYSKERISVDDLTLDAYFSTENMLPNKAGVTTATSLPSTAQTTKCHIGDVLISNIRPYFKKILYCHREGGCSSDVLCFSPSSKKLSAFLYGVLYSDSFFDFMVAGSKGTKMPRGDKQQIMTYPIYVPTNDELDEYNAIAMPILDDIYRNTMENSNLSSLRDTLLPRLISGEVDVSSVKI